MKRVLLSLFAVGLSINLSFAQNNYQSIADGDWTDPSIWQNGPAGTYPGENDNVTLQDSVYYDIINDTTYYGSITFNGGAELYMAGDNSISNHTVLGVNSDLNLNGPLTLGPNTVFLLQGNLTLNSNGKLTYLDKASIFRLSNPNVNANFNDTISIENGIFAMQATGSQQITINGNAYITVENNGSFYVEGSNTNASIDGTLIMKSGSQFVADLNANLSANVNGSITFEYGSSFFQGDNVNRISITGNQPVWEIQLTNGVSGWRHISSPFVGGCVFNDFVGTDLNPNVNPGQENIFWWDASIAPSTTEDAVGWTPINTSGNGLNEPFVAGGNAFTLYTGSSNYPFSNGGLVSIQKQAAYANSYPYTLYNTIDVATDGTHSGDKGWNLIGNPYPAWLNLDEFLTNEMFNEYNGAHMWDASVGQYKAYMLTGETIDQTHDITGTSTSAASSQYIRPFQAFWVKMDAASVPQMDIDILQSYRTYNPAAAPPSYFSSAFIPRLRLNAYAASDSAWDQVLITMNPNSSKLRLGNEDAFDRASANDRPNMALIHEDGERLCIDSRPLDSTTVFPLVFEQGVDAATYYISMVDDQFDASMSAYLEDLKTNTLHDLENGAYSFTHDKSYATNRFNIHLAPSFVRQSELKLAKNNFQIWTANDKLFIQLDKAGINQNLTIEVYDLSGKLVFGTSASAENTNTSIPLQLSAGAHIIKVNHPQYGSQVLKTIR